MHLRCLGDEHAALACGIEAAVSQGCLCCLWRHWQQQQHPWPARTSLGRTNPLCRRLKPRTVTPPTIFLLDSVDIA